MKALLDTLTLKATRAWLNQPVNAAAEPRWRVALYRVAAAPLVPFCRAAFRIGGH